MRKMTPDDSSGDDSDDGFISLNGGRKRRRIHGEASSEEDEIPNFRSIDGEAKRRNKPADEDLDYATENSSEGVEEADDDEFTFKRDEVQQKTRDLTTAVNEHPDDEQTWLALAAHQDVILSTAVSSIRTSKVAAAEVKLSVLQRGLQACPTSIVILREYMRIATNIWDARKVFAHWKKILDQNQGAVQLWKEYLQFCVGNAGNRYRDVLSVFTECLRVFREMVRDGKVDVEVDLVEIFEWTCSVMRQAGYTEQAVGAFQGMMELNYFRPARWDHLQADMNLDDEDDMLGDFEEFWDSEVPRFGEQGAKGWRNFNDSSEESLSLPDTGPPYAPEMHNIADDWSRHEAERAARCAFPARTTDADAIEDPYRVVLFDDVRDLLYVLTTESAREKLLFAWLAFNGLKMFASSRLPSGLEPKSFFPAQESTSTAVAYVHGEPMEPERMGGISGLTGFGARGLDELSMNLDLLFPSETWFQPLDVAKLTSDEVKSLQCGLAMIPGGKACIVRLASEAAVNPQGVRKVAKQMLQTNRTNLTLWNAYARVEAMQGNVDEARKVYGAALGMATALPEDEKQKTLGLWRMWAELEWEHATEQNAMNVLVAMTVERTDPVPINLPAGRPSMTAILKAKKYLDQSILSSLSLGDGGRAVEAMISRGLLEYLNDGLDPALGRYRTAHELLSSRCLTKTAHSEILYLAQARLLYQHTLHAPTFRTSLLRDVLEEAIKLFPCNTMFLSLLTWNESRTRIQNRVRKVLNETVLTDDENVSGWLFAIWAEMHMEKGRYNPHTVRNLFERAVSTARGATDTNLWKLWFHFECIQGDAEKARGVWVRGIDACPWSKDVAMLGCELPGIGNTQDQISKVYNIMLERGLRIRVELPEQEGGHGMGMKDQLPEDHSSDEEGPPIPGYIN
ncbi:hypothetical protein YB2330_003156 [Saitoella coloradoensis]